MNESDQLWEGKLAVACEIRVGLFGFGINVSWDQVKKRCNGIGELA
jgi:hypothetical protein